MRIRTALLTVVLVAGIAAGCTDGDDTSDAEPTTPTTATASVLSDLLAEGSVTCTDEEGDLTIASRSIVEPPVPVPGLDLLEAEATLDDDRFTTTFTLAAAPDDRTGPELITFVGLVDDLAGFEVQAKVVEGSWIAELATRGRGVNEATPLPDAEVTVDGAIVTVVVPRVDIPTPGPNQPVAFGSSGAVIDDTGALVDEDGAVVEDRSDAARAFEECLTFG